MTPDYLFLTVFTLISERLVSFDTLGPAAMNPVPIQGSNRLLIVLIPPYVPPLLEVWLIAVKSWFWIFEVNSMSWHISPRLSSHVFPCQRKKFLVNTGFNFSHDNHHSFCYDRIYDKIILFASWVYFIEDFIISHLLPLE